MFQFKVKSPVETSVMLAESAVEARAAAEDLTGCDYQQTEAVWMPQVGDGCSYQIGSDRYPFTVVEVSKSGHRVTVDSDKARGGLYVLGSGHQGRLVFTRRADGSFRTKGKSYGYLSPGRADYMDPSF